MKAIVILILTLSLFAGAFTAFAEETNAQQGEKTMIKTEDLHIRDPFILPVPEENLYYMYGTTRAMPHDGEGPFFDTFFSSDLKEWEGPIPVFSASPDFWGTMHFWAAEVHLYKGKYYMFATFGAENVMRTCQILVADSPRGPFEPLTDYPITPFAWQCLDGTLFVDDDDKPWIVFCREWEQVKDGEMWAMPLTDDLKYSAGKPTLLFKASEAPWIVNVPWKDKESDSGHYITDGPFMHRTKGGQLIMLWASFGENGYCQAIARSESGKITGPWTQDEQLLFDEDGGHAMIFNTFDGKMVLSLHAPNHGRLERPRFFEIEEKDNTLVILKKLE